MKKLSFVPDPPNDFNEEQLMAYNFIAINLLAEDSLYKEYLPAIRAISRKEIIHSPIMIRQKDRDIRYSQLANTEKYLDRFWFLVGKGFTHKQAYQNIEYEHEFHYGYKKYKTFNSFRNTRDKMIKSK